MRPGKAVTAHPLNLADPHRDARQFSGIRVDLDAPDVGRAGFGEGAGESQGFGLQLHPVLQVLERMQRQVQEISRTAGGIQNREGAQPREKVAE